MRSRKTEANCIRKFVEIRENFRKFLNVIGNFNKKLKISEFFENFNDFSYAVCFRFTEAVERDEEGDDAMKEAEAAAMNERDYEGWRFYD